MALAQLALGVGTAAAIAGVGWLVVGAPKSFDPRLLLVLWCLVYAVLRALQPLYLPRLAQLRFLRDDEVPQFLNPKMVGKRISLETKLMITTASNKRWRGP
jgi:hypothetical protein